MTRRIAFLSLSLTLFVFATVGQLAAQSDGYQIGDVVADFSLKSVDGEMVSMSDFDDAQGIILIVTCNSCPWAKKYEDRIIDLHKSYADKGFPVIAINPNDVKRSPDDSYEEMKVRAEEKGFPFDYVYDETQEVARALGATKTPEVYLVEKTDKGMVLRYHGAIDDNADDPSGVEAKFVENAIQAIMNGDEISETKTKAIGCTVKYTQS